ncbi:uncharacterized protein [Panulirus ornatus]|uniref:uncharacterized protein isoform X2 n=1 Tax=Panulirus ornatus TaxID=150431 RepID=UPI003A85C8EB
MSIIKRYCCVVLVCIVLIVTGFGILNSALLRKEAQLLSTLEDRHVQAHTLHLPVFGLVQVQAFTPPVEAAANMPVTDIWRFIFLVKNLLTLGQLVAQPVEKVTYVSLIQAFYMQFTCVVLMAAVVICSVGNIVRRVHASRATAPPAQVGTEGVAKKKKQRQIKADRPAQVPTEVVSAKVVQPAQVAKDGVAKKKKKEQPKDDRPHQVATEVVPMETKATPPAPVVSMEETMAVPPAQVAKDGVAKKKKKKKQPKANRPDQVATEVVPKETKATPPAQVVSMEETMAVPPAQVAKDGVAKKKKKKKQPKADRPAQEATEVVPMETKATPPAQVAKEVVSMNETDPPADPFDWQLVSKKRKKKATLPAEVSKKDVGKKQKKAAQPTWQVVRKAAPQPRVVRQAVAMEETKAAPPSPAQVPSKSVAMLADPPAQVASYAQMAMSGAAKKQTPQLAHEVWKPAPKKVK